MKKLIVVVLVFAIVLGACQNRSSTGQVSSGEGISGTLVLWFSDAAIAEALMEAFNAIHPNVVFEFERVSAGNAANMITLAGPSGTGPDVLVLGHDGAAMAIADGLLEPIPAGIQNRIDGLIQESAMATMTRDGILYGVPFQIDNIALFYNKDLVSRPPSSFEEIIEFSRTWNNPANRQYALRWPVEGIYNNIIFLTPFGYSPFGPNMDDWRNPGFDSPEMARGLAFYHSLRQVFDFPSADTDNDATVGAFQRGEVPYTIAGPWAIAGTINAGVNFGITKIPTINGVQPVCFAGVRVVAVSSYARNFEAAFAFAEFMASEEAAAILFNVGNVITSLKDISGIEGFSDNEYVQGILQQTPYSVPTPIIPEISIFWAPAQEMFSFLWDGLLTIEEAQAKAMDSYELLLQGMGRSLF